MYFCSLNHFECYTKVILTLFLIQNIPRLYGGKSTNLWWKPEKCRKMSF